MSSTKYVSYLIGKGGYLCPPIHLSGGAGVCVTGVGCLRQDDGRSLHNNRSGAERRLLKDCVGFQAYVQMDEHRGFVEDIGIVLDHRRSGTVRTSVWAA